MSIARMGRAPRRVPPRLGVARCARVALGTVAMGTVAMGTVAMGTVAMGTVAVGTVAVGTDALAVESDSVVWVSGSRSAAAAAVGSAAVERSAATPAWTLPLRPPADVVRPFRAPPGPYAAGHRGTDLAARGDRLVVAPRDGVVRFAGLVAGRGLVVIAHPDGVTTEYEPLTPAVHAGSAVRQGQPIGVVHGRHGSCAIDGCLHWAARRDGRYVDPMTLLAPLGVVRLLPWDGVDPID